MSLVRRARPGKLSLFQLAAATYLMACGGPYGIEELVQTAGYPLAILAIILVPIFWSLPVGLMVGELASAIPADGGYYVWVRRALGPFWGFQEAWLSMASSIFDMAVYPTIFVLSLAQLWPPAGQGSNGFLIGAAMVTTCILWNLLGVRVVGEGSLVLAAILLSPFLLVIFFCFSQNNTLVAASPVVEQRSLLAGLLVAMWNYMGWDNASTVAAEVENPQRTYPGVMLLAISAAFLTYLIPVAAVWYTGLPSESWGGGGWVDIARRLGGPAFSATMLLTTMVSMFGAFNSLTMSSSRVPMVLALDGYAPRILARTLADGTPWVSLVVCGVVWIAALGLSFDRLVLLDILTYGVALILEFVALIVLRITEPHLPRPFRLPGGIAMAVLAALGPTILLIAAAVKSSGDQLGPFSALHVWIVIIALGALAYWIANRLGVSKSA